MFKPNANVIRELDLPPEPEKEREGGGGLEDSIPPSALDPSICLHTSYHHL